MYPLRPCILLIQVTVLTAAVQAQEIKFSATADNRNYSGFSDVLNEIKLRAGGPGDFMISAGDIDLCADTWAALAGAFDANFIWYPVIGNHEMPGDGSESYYGENMNYLRSYDLGTVNHGPSGCTNTTYSFDAGCVHVACVNEYWDGGTYAGADCAAYGDIVPQLRTWLGNDLASTTRKWKIVVGHEPAYPQPDEDWGDARHVGDSLDANPSNRDAFWDLLEDHDVVAYICGHTHRFSHYQPPGSDVWQIDLGQARGIGRYDAFVIATADESRIRFDAYRSLGTSQFSLTDSWAVPEPAAAGLLALGALAMLRRRCTRLTSCRPIRPGV